VRFPKQQRGVALIVALLVVALATVLIASLLDRGELAIARVRNDARQAQAFAYAQGVEAYAARVLAQAAASGETKDSANSSWAVPLPPLPVPGGMLTASMRDRNGCFNLNNLLDTNGQKSVIWFPKFQRLLSALKLDENLADAVVDWRRATPTPDERYYLQQDPPYRPAQRGFVHVSELRLVRGVTADVYARLAPEVCALPRGTTININTASVAVLMTLSSTMTEQIAKAIAQDGHANFGQIEELNKLLPVIECGGPKDPVSNCYDVKSTHFLARGDVQIDGLAFTFYSLIERNYGGSSAAGIRVIERSRGADW
jgi:general secretion pathway protein K